MHGGGKGGGKRRTKTYVSIGVGFMEPHSYFPCKKKLMGELSKRINFRNFCLLVFNSRVLLQQPSIKRRAISGKKYFHPRHLIFLLSILIRPFPLALQVTTALDFFLPCMVPDLSLPPGWLADPSKRVRTTRKPDPSSQTHLSYTYAYCMHYKCL